MRTRIERIFIGPGATWANLGWLFIIATAGICVFLLSANFSRREQAPGLLVADPQIIRIDAPRSGRVQRIAVQQGQKVRKGDVLLYIDPEPVLVNGKQTAQAELARLETAGTEFRTRITAIERQIGSKVRELTGRVAAVDEQISALTHGIELQQANVAQLREQADAGRRLRTSGSLSADETRKREATLRDAEIVAQNLLYSLHEKQAALAELEGQKIQAPIEGDLKISDLRQSLLELEQRRADAEGRLAFQVAAPVAGIVDTILIDQGQTAGANATLVSILPESSRLVAELYVPSRAIVFVEPEQAVRIAYSAFPYVRYGFATGRIVSVSETVLRPAELREKADVKEPSYRVTVALESETMKAADKDIRLRPGLTLTADIILDRQTLAQWIFQSVAELWART